MKNFKLMALAAVAAVSLASCSSSDDAIETPVSPVSPVATNGVSVIKTAQIALTSNDVTLASNTGTRTGTTPVNPSLTDGGQDGEGRVYNYANRNKTVEVNLAMNRNRGTRKDKDDNDYSNDYIATKLSIHVRQAGNFEITLPVESQYFVVDDPENGKEADYSTKGYLAIRQNYNEKYIADVQKANQKVEYTLDGKKVEISVEYGDSCVKVSSTGLDNEDLMKALWDEHKDGLTVEVWTYYKSSYNNTVSDGLSRAALKAKLNTTTFIWDGAALTTTGDDATYKNAIVNTYEQFEYDDKGMIILYTDEACTQKADYYSVTYDETTGERTLIFKAPYADATDNKKTDDDAMKALYQKKTLINNVDPEETSVVLDCTVTYQKKTTAGA